MFSKTFGYALRALTFVVIEARGGRKVGLQDISGSLDIPRHFLGKIMQDLVRHGILESVKGPSGGFFPNQKTASAKLTEILKITDGNLVFEECAMGIKRCNRKHPCPLHQDFAICRDAMLKALYEKSVGMLAADVESGASHLSFPHYVLA